ncbi:MAG: PTS transporter subunit EIIC [Clostridium sp.]
MAKESKEYRVAKEILEHVGGKENIKSVEHCATRLRLILNDKEKFDEKAIEEIDGVKGQFFASGQHQIILGTGFVNKVFNEVQNMGIDTGNVKAEVYKNMSMGQKISRIFGDIFLPIIPVLVATGLFMGIRGAIVGAGIDLGPTWMRLSQVLTDTAFVFLPALVAWSTAKRFGGTPVIGLVLGLMLVSPSLPNVWNVVAGSVHPIILNLFGFKLHIVGYQASVLPALALGAFSAFIEKRIRKIVPDVLDLILTPFLTLLISLVLGLIVIGPITQMIQNWLFAAFEYFLTMPYGIGGLLIGGVYQGIVVTGLHQIFNALEIGLLAKYHADPFNAVITGTIIAQGAAGLAVALKTKDKKKRIQYISFVIPAFLGITEPVIFGINLRLLKPFLCGLAGGAVAGCFASFIHLAADGMGITVLPGILLYINHNLIGYIITNALGFGVAFILTMIVYKPKLDQDIDLEKEFSGK